MKNTESNNKSFIVVALVVLLVFLSVICVNQWTKCQQQKINQEVAIEWVKTFPNPFIIIDRIDTTNTLKLTYRTGSGQGFNSMPRITTGMGNVAIGHQALYSIGKTTKKGSK